MKEIHFELICECGFTISGFFSDTDNKERLHCSCGLVWEIKRPYQEKKKEE